MNCCENMYDAINSWKVYNYEYEHYYFDNDKRINFIDKYFDKSVLNVYLSLIAGAFKADLWRCCVLYINGGVYIDSDMVCLVPLREYILPNYDFFLARDGPMSKSYLFNGFIASTPKHPFLKKQIDEIVYNVENKLKPFYLDICGPGRLGKSVNKCLQLDENSEYILGENNINNYNFVIAFHDWKTKNIRLHGETGNPLLITEYPNKKEDMNKIGHKSYYDLYMNDIIYQIIPRNIYYTTKDELDINSYMVNSFIDKNKHWELNYYNDDDVFIFFKKNNDILIKETEIDVFSYYVTLTNGGEKSDLWRYCVIYLMGGVYVDADIYCNTQLDKWIYHHDLILGIEAFLDLDVASTFGMHKIGHNVNNKVISVCNWAFASIPKHVFFKELIKDICSNPISNNVLNNTGPGRFTKHAVNYFSDNNLLLLENQNIIKDKSILYNINKFGSNQCHSNSYKNFENSFDCKVNDVYLIHKFDSSWRFSYRNKKIQLYNSSSETHNLTIIKNENGYLGVCRLDKDKSRTHFMKCIGDCRSLCEMQFDNNFNTLYEKECLITNIEKKSKFEDYRFFTYINRNYLSVSYIDENFNTKIAILDDTYKYLGDVNIEKYNKVSFINNIKVIWEKNWLFFEKSNELYFIYTTTPNYILYKCVDFEKLEFVKHIDVKFPLNKDVPNDEKYFTSHVGSDVSISTGGSTNPIYIKEKDVYIYLIHTKTNFIYNHYMVILNSELLPIDLCETPIINGVYLKNYHYFFIMTMLEKDNYLTISGGITDSKNFIWELSKEQIYRKIGL